jgi:hypothetical protein
MTIKELAKESGKCEKSIYNLAKKLGRTPTLEEIKNIKIGRPKKYI